LNPPSPEGFRAMLDFMCVRDPKTDKLCYDLQAEMLPQLDTGVTDPHNDVCTLEKSCDSAQAKAIMGLGCCIPSFIAANKVYNLDSGYISEDKFYDVLATITACSPKEDSVSFTDAKDVKSWVSKHQCDGPSSVKTSDMVVLNTTVKDCSVYTENPKMGALKVKIEVSKKLNAKLSVRVHPNDITLHSCKPKTCTERRLQGGHQVKAQVEGDLVYSVALSSTDIEERRQKLVSAAAPLSLDGLTEDSLNSAIDQYIMGVEHDDTESGAMAMTLAAVMAVAIA